MHISAALLGYLELIWSSKEYSSWQTPLSRTQGPCRAELWLEELGVLFGDGLSCLADNSICGGSETATEKGQELKIKRGCVPDPFTITLAANFCFSSRAFLSRTLGCPALSPHLMNEELKVRARLSPRFPPQAGARGEPNSVRVTVTCIAGTSLWPGAERNWGWRCWAGGGGGP